MQSVKRMIDKALRHVASEADLATRLGVDQQRLWNWKEGRRSMPSAAIIELAHIGGLDPKNALGEYHYEWHEKKQGFAPVGIAAALSFLVALGVPPPSDAATPSSGQHTTHYAHWWINRLRLLLRLEARDLRALQLRGR